MKKWFCLLLATVMLFSCIPLNALAAESGSKNAQLAQPEANAVNRSSTIRITWNAVKGADSYRVYRRVSGGSWERLSTETDTVYYDSDVKGGVTYTYRVRAVKDDTLSSGKQTVSIVRLEQPRMKLGNIAEGVSVKWDAVKGAKSYRVYRKVTDGSWKLIKSGLTDLSYTDKTAKYGVEYHYSVRACSNDSLSYYHQDETVLRIEQPTLKASNSPAGIKTSWNEIAEAESYNVYRKVSGGEWILLANVTKTSYQDRNVEDGVTYFYRVRAKSGDALSSNKQYCKILRLARPVVTASNAGTGVKLEWNQVKGAESYRVYRKVPGGSWKTLKTGLKELTYTDTTAKSGSSYQYTVRAYGKGVLSGFNSTEEIQYLSRPTLTVKNVSATRLKLQWNAVKGAEKYIVYVKTADTDWETLYTGTDTSYTAKKLTLGQTYSFKVRAVSDEARSVRSAAVSGKATYPAPDYSVKLKAGKGIQISWDAVDGAGSYRVYRRVPGGSWKTLKTTTSTSYVDTTGKGGTTYEYAVRAFELAKAGGVYGIRAEGKKIVYSKIDPSKPMVALTFDDGPSAYTKDILNQLEKYGAHATFFVVGNRVSSYASTIQRAYNIGCEIGNHSWSHPELSAISVNSMRNELDKTDAAIKKIIGKNPELLRPPYGAVDSDVKKYAGKPLIHWSIDTRDWATRSSSSTISSVLNNVRDGSIVLMHDIYSATRDAAVSLIPTLISRGYQLVTVSEMAAYRGINLKDGTIYYSIR